MPHTMADIARTLASERGDDAGAEMLFWAEATRASIESHRRDVAPTADGDPRTADGVLRALEHDGARDGRRDGLRLPARPGAQAAVDRLPRSRRHARPELLRPARLRSAPGELLRDRQGRCPDAALVPPRARRHAGRTRRGADLLVGIDVRVPDAVAGDARAGRQPARADEPPASCAGRSTMAPSSACPGASRNPPTTPATWSSPTSTRTSACRAWA